MTRASELWIVLTVAAVGIWGCAQGPAPGPSATDRVKALEVKNSKLEDDFRAVAAARDQLRRKLASAEEQEQELRKQLQDQLRSVQKERDDLRQQLAARTCERDSVINQFEHVRKGLKELLGQTEAVTTPAASEPVSTTEESAVPDKL